MYKIAIIMNHKPTFEQLDELEQNFKNPKFVYCPVDISNIPTSTHGFLKVVDDIKTWLKIEKPNRVWVQTEPGLTCAVVGYCAKGYIPCMYAVTARESVEKNVDGKVIKTSVFKHKGFRTYML